MKSIKVIIAAHKSFPVSEDPLYLPVFVGSANKADIGFQRDDEGANISLKNPYFCELTGLYWAIHNLDADYIGLCHYRRYFALKKKNKEHPLESVLTLKEAEELLKKSDIILPKKRNYYIMTIYEHYKNTMYVEPLDEAGRIIAEKYPDYLAEFERLKVRRSGHMFNMMIMKREILKDYCDWLFDILFELEKRCDVSQYDAFHQRFFGRVSERLLDVYLNTNHLSYMEVPLSDLGEVNWWKKGYSFLMARVFKKKYDRSF